MRTAMVVAQLGTVRAASRALGIHRATVTRHIDALENDLGVRLFLRHNDGYALTSGGEPLRRLAESTDRLVAGFVQEVTTAADRLSGTLTISTLVRVAPIIAGAIRSFQREHPDVVVQVIADNGLSQLELGDIDLAIRIGAKPDNPDYVVLPFRKIPVGLFGHRDYLSRKSQPQTRRDLADHQFVAIQMAGGSLDVCEFFEVSRDAVAFMTNDPSIALNAVTAGLGLGMVAEPDSRDRSDLIEILPDEPLRQAEAWIVTHVDMHRTRLLQAFLIHVRAFSNAKSATSP